MSLSSCCIAIVSALGVVSTSTAAPPERTRIVAFGDSLTSGHGIGASQAYPAILQKTVDEAGFDYEVVNAGVSGDTSTRALTRLERALEGNVRVPIVAIGPNDGLRGASVDQI